MLRAAYAAQRDQSNPSQQSESSIFSMDSSFDYFLNREEQDPEELLMDLGFGGPSHGLDRIPERFIQQPSQVS